MNVLLDCFVASNMRAFGFLNAYQYPPWPRLAGSWPGYVFTGEPLNLPAGHFGLGHGNGAHAPTEYYAIESADPRIQGMDGAVLSQVEYLYEPAVTG